jgi:hypothetical protein
VERFSKRKSLAGILQPGDHTRYEMVAVEDFGCYHVAVFNSGFQDVITFLIDSTGEAYSTMRGSSTNPWTVKAAFEMVQRLKGEIL